MKVILTHITTGYQEEGELINKSDDCYPVQRPDGSYCLYPMKEWTCEEVKERKESLENE